MQALHPEPVASPSHGSLPCGESAHGPRASEADRGGLSVSAPHVIRFTVVTKEIGIIQDDRLWTNGAGAVITFPDRASADEVAAKIAKLNPRVLPLVETCWPGPTCTYEEFSVRARP